MPQLVDQLSEILEFFVALPVVAEQVIEAPTTTLEDTIPQQAALCVLQVAEQLVGVPVPSSDTCALSTGEEEFVALARDDAGRTWFRVRGPRGLYWWLSGARHVQWAPPEGLGRRARPTDTGADRRPGG